MSLIGDLVFSRYRIVRPVGRGASCVVVLAVDPEGAPFALSGRPREIEVDQNGETVLTPQHVGWLEVPVNDPVGVQVFQGAPQLV